ncbi:MAG: hypothetical protein L6R38_000064 [Xanthoria sp. 2 TBL-2021]|nr:MAG: hypothetical protein L6R38_000064 [Xanthoria sp. 2 TBL-2021]
MADNVQRSHNETALSATAKVDSRAVDNSSQTDESCHQCTLHQWRRSLEQQRIGILEHERAKISAEFNTFRTSFRKLQEDHDTLRSELTRLHIALAKKEGDFQAEQHAKNHTILHWQAEKESRKTSEIRLTQALHSLGQFANVFYLAQIDVANLTREQKEALRRMDYAGVVQERDAFRVRCFELQSVQRRSRPSFQAYQPCVTRAAA